MIYRIFTLFLLVPTLTWAVEDTEDLSTRASSQLSILAHWITDRGPLPTVVSTPEATSTELAPPVTLTTAGSIHHGEGLPTKDTAPLAHQLEKLPAAVRAKFKLYSIALLTESPLTFETRQFLSLYSPGQATESTWAVRWSLPEGETAPRITSITLEAHAATASPALFTDTTTTTLSGAAAYQLSRSAPHWLNSISSEISRTQNFYQGLAVGDADGDGWDDVYICQGPGLPNRLLLTRADGRSEDISAACGLDLLDHSRSAIFVDLDNDGDQDLAVATKPGVIIFENLMASENRFTKRAGLIPFEEIMSLSSADYDADGLPDLFACVYRAVSQIRGDRFNNRPSPRLIHDANNGGRNHLFRNTGNFTFEDTTETSGIDATGSNKRFSFAAGWEDIDQDGDQDLYIANDFGANCLYQNDGKGRFTNSASSAGVEDSSFGMSVAWGDVDRDNLTDLYVSNMFSAAGNRITYQPGFKNQRPEEAKAKQYLSRGNSLFTQKADGTFQDTSTSSGTIMGRWAWASVFTDLDHDGWDDILVANGYLTNVNLDDDL